MRKGHLQQRHHRSEFQQSINQSINQSNAEYINVQNVKEKLTEFLQYFTVCEISDAVLRHDPRNERTNSFIISNLQTFQTRKSFEPGYVLAEKISSLAELYRSY